MKKKPIISALALTALSCLFGGVALGYGGEGEKEVKAAEAEYVSLIENGDLENGTTEPFFVGGNASGTFALATDIVYEGDYALKFSGRTTDSRVNYASYEIELGKTYVFSAYAYSVGEPMWFNLQATPWALHNGGSLWGTAGAPGVLLEANTWTNLTAEFRFYTENGGLYAVCNGGTPVLMEDHSVSPKISTFRNMHHVDFEISALANLDTMYVDNVVLYEKDFPYGEKNLAVNGGVEQADISMYKTLGVGTVGRSSAGEPVWKGASSLKYNFTGANDYLFQNVSSAGMRLNTAYTYSVMIHSTVTTWANLVVTPWTLNNNGNPMWTDVNIGILLEANQWMKFNMTVSFETDANGAFFINLNGGKTQVLNHGNLSDSQVFASLSSVDIKYTSYIGGAHTVYFDEFKFYDTTDPKEAPTEEPTPDPAPVEKEHLDMSLNSVRNGGFEKGVVPFFAGGLTGGNELLEAVSNIKYTGDYALKFSGRTTSTLNYSSFDFELGKTYVYTAWVYSTVPMWFNLQATVWAQHDGGSLWNTAAGPGVLTEANTWTELTAEFKIYAENGKLYISCNGGDGVLAQDHAASPKVDNYRNVHHVDLEINALAELDTMYVDNVSLREKTYADGYANIAANGNVETGKTDGYYTFAPTGATAAVSVATDKVFNGDYSLQFDRSGASQTYRSIFGLKVNRTYHFSVYAYTDVATWANLICTPWGVNTKNNMMWNDSGSNGFLLQAGLWTKLYCTYHIYTDAEGKLWIDNGIAPAQALNHGDYNDLSAFSYLQKVDFKFTALDNATKVYLDEFTVYDVENPHFETENTGKVENKTVVACIGSSITEGAGGTRPYTAVLQDWLGTEEYLVRNYGKSGAAVTPTGALPYTSTVQYQESLRSDADVVFLMLGLNDLYPQNYAYIDEYEDNFKALVLTYVNLPSKPVVYILSSTTTYPGNAGGYSDEVALAEIIPVQRKIAEELGLTFIDMHTPTENHPEWFADGLHPNDAGYEQIAGIVYKTLTGEDAPIEEPEVKPDDSEKVNLFKNPSFEDGNTRPFKTQGKIKMELTQEDTHTGDYAIKLTDRQTVNDMVFQALAGTQIRMNEWYRFSVWVKPNATIWSAIILTPWASGKETGANIWIDSYGDTKIVSANVWTKLDCEFMLGVDESGKLWVDNGTEKVYAKNWENTGDVTFNVLQQVDFKVNATMEATEIYVDDFRLTCNYEVVGGEIPEAPTGHGGNENTEMQLGQMFSNASFELDLFGTAASPNGAIWFTYTPCGVEQNTKYSHSGSASAEIFGRTTAAGQFLVNMNTIRVSRTYTYSAYLSSRQATEAAIRIEMWGFKFLEDGTQANPNTNYYTEFKQVDSTGWTYFELTFRYEKEGEDLVLYVDDQEVGRAKDATDLSCFTFGFITNEEDKNYLTDIYMDTCSLKDITDSSSSGISSGNVVVLPFEKDDEDVPMAAVKPSGCASSLSTFGVWTGVCLAWAILSRKGKKRGDDR